MLDDMRTERDCWRDQAQRLALTAPVPAGPTHLTLSGEQYA
jgi:hypothetical protein